MLYNSRHLFTMRRNLRVERKFRSNSSSLDFDGGMRDLLVVCIHVYAIFVECFYSNFFRMRNM
jgi:hypothetical protein